MFWFGDIFYQIWHIIIVGAYAAVGNFYGEDQNFQRVIIDLWRLSCQCLFPPLFCKDFEHLCWRQRPPDCPLDGGGKLPSKPPRQTPHGKCSPATSVNKTLHSILISPAGAKAHQLGKHLCSSCYNIELELAPRHPRNLFIENILRACPEL